MRVLVCGSRDWQDRPCIVRALIGFPEETVFIHGACRGADMLADEVVRERGFIPDVFPAYWKEQRQAAGPIRNSLMLKEGKPDLVIAFHDDINGSKGTKDMVQKARKAKIPVIMICSSDRNATK